MKTLKVFHNGQRLKDVYVGASRYQVFKYRLARFIRKTVLVLVLLSIYSGVFYALVKSGQGVSYTAIVQAKEVDTLKDKIEVLKNEVLDTITKCENPTQKASVITDSNNKPSVGNYMYQLPTVKGYMKLLYGETVTDKEAILIALDDVKARQLTKDIIFTAKKGDKGVLNWFNCAKKHDLEAKVAFINKLSN